MDRGVFGLKPTLDRDEWDTADKIEGFLQRVKSLDKTAPEKRAFRDLLAPNIGTIINRLGKVSLSRDAGTPVAQIDRRLASPNVAIMEIAC